MAEVSLTLLVLKTQKVEQFQRFYQTIGIAFAEEQHGKGPIHFAGQVGGVVIEIYPYPEDGTPVDTSARLGFAVEDLTEVVQAL
jgi:lactoylglutathione lyase